MFWHYTALYRGGSSDVVAPPFLDSYFTIHTVHREARVFFQEFVGGRVFTNFITMSEDVERFTSLMATTGTMDAPGLITATLLQNCGPRKVDTALLISRTFNSVILGIAVSKEQFPTNKMGFPTDCLGLQSDILDSDQDGLPNRLPWSPK